MKIYILHKIWSTIVLLQFCLWSGVGSLRENSENVGVFGKLSALDVWTRLFKAHDYENIFKWYCADFIYSVGFFICLLSSVSVNIRLPFLYRTMHYIVQSAVMRSPVVRLSVCDVGVL